MLLAGLALSACGSDDDKDGGSAGPEKVETTRVQVVGDIGKDGDFNPAAIYKRLAPGVVTIISLFDGRAPREPLGDPRGGQGSGFVIDDQGHIATNAHVVTSGTAPRLRRSKQVFVEFADGNRVQAKIVGTDADSDVGLLKIDPKGLSLTPLRLGSSKDLIVGEPVAAIGSPFGERQSLSVGVISAVDRNIQSLTAFRIANAVQTDAAINHGNSGGPLLDARGRVIGINAQIESSSGEGSGVGFAIPVDTVRRSIAQMRADGTADYAFLGITSATLYPQLARRLGSDAERGALVVSVQGPAKDAGLESGKRKIEFQGDPDIPAGGDVIVAIDGRPVRDADDLTEIVGFKRPGEQVELEVVRGDDRRTVTAKLAKRPARGPERPQR